jgi:hypothetical protein
MRCPPARLRFAQELRDLAGMERQHDRRTPMAQGGQEGRHRLVSQARSWNAAKQAAGRYGGTLGSSCMRVLECLAFDFQNYRTGRLDPSYEGIAAETGLGRSTVAEALARLKQLGIIHWVQRSAHHMLIPPSQWRGVELPPEPEPPDPGTWGDHPPLPSVIEQAITERTKAAASPRSLPAIRRVARSNAG